MSRKKRTMYLCAGLQSSGTTLISWCFLQRSDMDGILDANNDMFTDVPSVTRTPFTWLKTTISSFRMAEMVDHYQDLGWIVRPLLICRDVREVVFFPTAARANAIWHQRHDRGRPAVAAEVSSGFWKIGELFRDEGLAHSLSYDQFLINPKKVLRRRHKARNSTSPGTTPWWPGRKPRSAIMETERHGNDTFRKNFGTNLWDSLKPTPKSPENLAIPSSEWFWLEKEFAQYNRVNGYLAHLSKGSTRQDARAVVPFHPTAITRRSLWRMRQKPLRYIRRSKCPVGLNGTCLSLDANQAERILPPR